MSTESLGSRSGSFLQPRRLLEECPEQNLQIVPAEMIKPFSSPRQQEDHFRNSVSDGGSPRGALPTPSDRPVIPMTISQNTHGVGVVYPAEMIKPFSSPQQQEGHFRKSVSDSVPIPSDRPMIPMTISQNTHGVVVYSPSSQDGHFTRDHNTCQPTKVRTSQNTPVAVSPDGYNRNKCFISGGGGSGPLDRQATMKMNGVDVPKIQCRCGSGTCIVKTSHTEKNPNRLFYKCPAEICNFFQWCDGLGPSSQSPLKPGQGRIRSPGKIINPQNTPLEPKNPTCSCKAGPCIVQTMHHGENKGRKYYACPIKKGHGACKHFDWVDSPVKTPETESYSKINQNNIPIVDVTAPEPKQTLSPYESVKDLFGENDMRTIEFWCKEKDPNSAAASGSEINKQLSPGKRPHQLSTMGDISPMKRLNLSDAFQVAENCPNCGKRGQCIECPILTCFKDDDFSENKHWNAMDGGNISALATISPVGETSVQNVSPGSLKRAGRCFTCGKEGQWSFECTSPCCTNSACFKCGKTGHWMKNCNL